MISIINSKYVRSTLLTEILEYVFYVIIVNIVYDINVYDFSLNVAHRVSLRLNWSMCATTSKGSSIFIKFYIGIFGRLRRKTKFIIKTQFCKNFKPIKKVLFCGKFIISNVWDNYL